MPYIDIFISDDAASLWYLTNSLHGNVGGFNPNKPTIIILPPLFLDSTWLYGQFNDPRLDSGYNIIAFDMRACGQSKCKPTSLHDTWVDAADLAHAHRALRLPACHILAFDTLSVNCALRFAILFPELCLSLTLCSVPPPTDLKRVFHAYDELVRSLCYAVDLESFELAARDVSHILLGEECDIDLQDDLIEYWERSMPPAMRVRTIELFNVVMNRSPLTERELAEVTHPVLIIQGERCPTCPLKYAEELATDLVNAQGGAHVYTVKGASTSLILEPSSSSIVNQVFTKFLSRLPLAASELVAPVCSTEERMKKALSRLARLAGDVSIGKRDPKSPLSFSCIKPEVQKIQLESLQSYAKDLNKVFWPLDTNGRPQRKYSDRNKEHWFYPDRDGMSYAASELASAYQKARTYRKELMGGHPGSQNAPSRRPSTETISKEFADMGNSTTVVVSSV